MFKRNTIPKKMGEGEKKKRNKNKENKVNVPLR